MRLNAKEVRDTRGDKTIEVVLKTNFGTFRASSPNGKSRGKFEAKPWKGSLKHDISIVNNFSGRIELKDFDDLINVEEAFEKKVGANTMIALEYVFLKMLAKKKKRQVWQLINPNARKFPMPIGNVVEGGKHSSGKRPDFQEFWFIPNCEIKKAIKTNQLLWKKCGKALKKIDKRFKGGKTDENAWQTKLSNNQAIMLIDILKKRSKVKVNIGIDAAASEFYKKNKYDYQNEKEKLTKAQQIEYLSKLSTILYLIEDPLDQTDFAGFAQLKKKSKGLIIGDDLTVTNLTRIKKAHKMKAIDAVIIKPNQSGSLIKVKEIVKYCKKNKIKTIFSHRSGETKENILTDLAFGFQADFIKTGVIGKGRSEKLNRLIAISKSVR